MDKIAILNKYFGYESFREGQSDIIDCILNKNDVLGVMPTGAGKSICYQIPALINEGITLVISPLISLMQDQVMSLVGLGIPAAYINSSLTSSQYFKAMDNATKGKYKLIYVAPERLLSPRFLEFATNANISMVAVDEAHCISQWGQDFRPGYLEVTDFINALPNRPVVAAFTATATKKVREDIASLLELKNPASFVTGFNRENLYFSTSSPQNKFLACLEFIKAHKNQSGIIYCSTRKNVDMVHEKLLEADFPVTKYHAGLEDNERKQNQEDFLYDRSSIMVATNAFGMGIDKSNVSYVIHYNMPKDIESYYQEAGRAGRDGSLAKCLLLYSGEDVATQKFFIEQPKDNVYLDEEMAASVRIAEHRRLQKMVFYSTTSYCLRKNLLEYFGEKAPERCGYCSNCDTAFEDTDITIDAQKILSCVARMPFRVGIGMIIDVLRGSKNEKVLKHNFDQLSTYNISDKSSFMLKSIINHLIQNEFLSQGGDFNTLSLSNRSREVLKGEIKLSMLLPKEKPKAPKKQNLDLSEELIPLFQKLRELRASLAKNQGIPAFWVFGDAQLVDICNNLPTTLDAFSKISGVGAAKLEKYGAQFTNAVKEFTKE